MKIRVGLIPNLDHETKKTKIRTWQMQDNNSTRFFCNNEIKIEQGCDKRMFPKLMLNRLKIMGNSTSMYTH